jgi:lipopolysaccharide transport system permease protein
MEKSRAMQGGSEKGTDSLNLPVYDIAPSSPWRLMNLRELWAYRELVFFLTWRDIKVRYKQTAIGVLWVVLQPVTMMIVFTLIFGRLAGVSSPEVPYPLFAFSALLPWQLFSRAITDSTNSLVTDQRLISRVYFPRIIVPIASVLAAAVDFLVSGSILFFLILGYGVPFRMELAWTPILALLVMLASLGVGFWLSALNIEYRDVAYTLPFLNQFLFFITPVVYPASLIPEKWRALYGLNPMAGCVEAFRWALLGVGEKPGAMLAVSGAASVVIFLTGMIWFRRRERAFADVIGSGGR